MDPLSALIHAAGIFAIGSIVIPPLCWLLVHTVYALVLIGIRLGDLGRWIRDGHLRTALRALPAPWASWPLAIGDLFVYLFGTVAIGWFIVSALHFTFVSILPLAFASVLIFFLS